MGALRIALAQINPVVGDLKGNLDKISYWMDKARQADADVVTFPELCLCGYPPEDLLLRPSFLRDSRTALESLIPLCDGLTVVMGFPDSVNGEVYNAAALIHNTKLLDVYYKIELPNYGVFDEKRYFRPGSRCVVFDLCGARFSLTICEDIWVPGSKTERCASRNRAQFVINISASPFYAGKAAVRLATVVRFAQAANATLFYNNMVGGQDELVFDGGSAVVGPDGELIASARRFEEDLLITDVAVECTPEPEETWNLNSEVHVIQSRSFKTRRLVPSGPAAELGRLEEIYTALVLGTRDYVLKNGFKKVVIGLSGGIDSALTAAVAVEALGREHVVGVTMPSQFTSGETLSDAATLARNLGIRLITVPIEGILRSFLGALAEPFREGTPGLEVENLQARIRGTMLMALSNRFGWLVLNTGNKSETAVGYCTLYGDMVGGYAVVKDVPKTLVFELADYVNHKAASELIPKSIIVRPPSAELRPDQKDEDSLPPYALLDPILRAYVEEDRAPDEIKAFDPDMVREVVAMVDRNEYKRRQGPPGIKITPKAFGRDRRLPLTNRYLNGGTR